MSRPIRRLSVAVTSALSVTALTLGLAGPAAAAPVPTLGDPGTVAAATEDLLDSPLLDRLPGATRNELKRVSAQRTSAAPTATATASSTPVIEEVARTETSFTFRATLPEGEVTRDGAVLQAYASQGIRVSILGYLTDAGTGLGAQPYDTYEDQLLGLEVADLVRENFTVTGATAFSQGMDDHFTVPAGRNSFDITITSARNHEELREALREITGIQPEDAGWDEMDVLAEQILKTRLEIPDTQVEITWSYGEKLVTFKAFAQGHSEYPDGANELSVTRTGNRFNSTTTVTRTDDNEFTGDRVLYFQDSMSGLDRLPVFDDFMELWNKSIAPPLRPGILTTEVTGATEVRDGFFRPNSGVDTITARTVGNGPQTEADARTQFTTWVTGTCDAEMSDTIPGYPLPEGVEPITWQQYLDEMVTGYDTEDGTSPEAVIYTGPSYIDAVQDTQDAQIALVLELAGISLEEFQGTLGMFASFPDWDAACGTTDDPGETQTPAKIEVDVPSTGVAGQPITLSAKVTDSAGNPVAGQDVTFTIDEQEEATGTLRAAALTLNPAADEPATLSAKTDSQGVATVQYTPRTSGTLRISASTGGTNPVITEAISPVTVTPAPGDGDGDNDDNPGGGGTDSPKDSGSLGSIFGSLGS